MSILYGTYIIYFHRLLLGLFKNIITIVYYYTNSNVRILYDYLEFLQSNYLNIRNLYTLSPYSNYKNIKNFYFIKFGNVSRM